MDKSGIISQRGFEYQKLVFIYNSLLISGEHTLGYECLDDVNIQTVENAIIKSNDRLIQVKSGDVNRVVFSKVLINWLFKYDLSYKYTLYSENKIDFDYKSREFIDDVVEKILISEESNKSNIGKAKDAFSADRNRLSAAILHIVTSLEIIFYTVEDLKKKTFDVFKGKFGIDLNDDIVAKQLNAFVSEIRDNLADKMLKTESFTLNFRSLHSIIHKIQSSINKDVYEVSYTKFRKSALIDVEKFIAGNDDSVLQLKKLKLSDNEIIDRITEQIFYKDFRNYFSVFRSNDIDDLEYLAHTNYVDAKRCLSNLGKLSPLSLYRETIDNRPLASPLFKSDSSNSVFFEKGCYIYLTSSSIANDLKIKWDDLSL